MSVDSCSCDLSYCQRLNRPKFEGESTTHAQFKPYQISKPPIYEVPKHQGKSYDSELLQTNYTMHYKQPKQTIINDFPQGISGALTGSHRQNYLSQKEKLPFYSQTEYGKEFQAKPVKIEKQPFYQYKPNRQKFEETTSYKSDFTQKKNQDLIMAGQQTLRAGQTYQKPKMIFSSDTAYKDAFKKYDVKVQQYPQYRYQPKNIKFQGESNYKSNFKDFPKELYHPETKKCSLHPERMALR